MSTDDIVRRLRALVIMDEVGSNNPLGREAADEIERLRAKQSFDDINQSLGMTAVLSELKQLNETLIAIAKILSAMEN